MKIRSIALSVIAISAASAAFAGAPERKPAEQPPAAREQRLIEELTASMRDILRAVTPEISMPKLELKLPSLERNAG